MDWIIPHSYVFSSSSWQENNFKAVLETIRDLMNTAYVGKAVPPWLHDVFLGCVAYAAAKPSHTQTTQPPLW
jgi:hypothetical protein